MIFYDLPIPALDKIYFYSSNYSNNYDKIINQMKYNNVLKEYNFYSQDKLSKNLIGNFILSRLLMCKILKKVETEGYNSIGFQKCWNIFLKYHQLQRKYCIFEKILFSNFLENLNLCI